MIIKLNIKNISNDKEQIMAQYIKETIDAFMDVVRTLDELEELEEDNEDDMA